LTAGFLNQLRLCRRPLIAVAVVLVALQALVTGLATAQSAAIQAGSPFDAGVICHGAGGGSEPPVDGTPSSGEARDLCCAFCAAAAPAVLWVTQPVVGQVERACADRLARPAGNFVWIAWRAVRAGPSQAPPSVG